MMRLLGFIVGSAASIGAILLILGIPEFHLANPHLDKNRFDEALQALKEKQREIENAPVPAADAPPHASATSPNPASAEPEAALVESTPAPDEPEPGGPRADPADSTLPPVLPGEQHWHSFWNPFRSEIAARGFVSQLERVTGLDYRVVKVKTGVYEVAFAYDNDLERQAKLSQIQAATGLDLPGS